MQESATARFEALVAAFRGRPDVTGPRPGDRGFGATALRADGRIFALLGAGDLVVRLPKERVATLVAAGSGHVMEAGGRRMAGWLVVAGDDALLRELAEEALVHLRAE